MTPMDCTLVQGRLSEFSDGCVVDAERRALEAHVARCKACYARLEEYRTLRRSLQALPKQTVPSPVAYYVRSAASREASRRRLYAGFDGWMREKVDSKLEPPGDKGRQRKEKRGIFRETFQERIPPLCKA